MRVAKAGPLIFRFSPHMLKRELRFFNRASLIALLSAATYFIGSLKLTPDLSYSGGERGWIGAKVLGIVGRDGGYTAQMGDAVVVVPTVNPDSITPHSEAFQAVIWHLLVTHPDVKASQTKWESAVR